MDPTHEVADRFDRVAPTYDEYAVPRWLAEQVALCAMADPPDRVLDVATGTGMAIEAMISLGSTATFTGVDISAGMLAQAASKPLASRTDLRQGDANRLPFGDNVFDLTLCVSAMAFFLDPVLALAEWRRVTRDGRIIFTAWTEGGLTLPRMVRQATAEAGVHLPDPNNALSNVDAIGRVAAAAGLRVARLTVVEHQSPMLPSDAAAWDRVAVGALGESLRQAGEATQERARALFHRLLADAVDAGETNRSRTRIVECRV